MYRLFTVYLRVDFIFYSVNKKKIICIFIKVAYKIVASAVKGN